VRRRTATAAVATLALWSAQSGTAVADNCGSPADCFFSERAAIVALIGIATLGALLVFGPGAAAATLFWGSDVAELATGRDLLTWEESPRWWAALGMIDPTPGNVAARGARRAVREGLEEGAEKGARRVDDTAGVPPQRGAPGGGRKLDPHNREEPVYGAPAGYFDDAYWRRVEDLPGDPDRGFKVTPSSWDEAKVAAHMEKRGDFGRLERPSKPGQGDFVDEAGQHWDIKGFDDSNPGKRGNYVPSPGNDAEVIQKLTDQFRDGRKVVLDTRYLSPEPEADLRRIVVEQGWEAQDVVKWYP
jgi:hypothetical protein